MNQSPLWKVTVAEARAVLAVAAPVLAVAGIACGVYGHRVAGAALVVVAALVAVDAFASVWTQ